MNDQMGSRYYASGYPSYPRSLISLLTAPNAHSLQGGRPGGDFSPVFLASVFFYILYNPRKGFQTHSKHLPLLQLKNNLSNLHPSPPLYHQLRTPSNTSLKPYLLYGVLYVKPKPKPPTHLPTYSKPTHQPTVNPPTHQPTRPTHPPNPPTVPPTHPTSHTPHLTTSPSPTTPNPNKTFFYPLSIQNLKSFLKD